MFLVFCLPIASAALAGNLEDIRTADLYKSKGDYTSAIQLYTRVIRNGGLKPIKLSGVLFKRGSAFGIIGETQGRLDDYARAVNLNPDNTYFRLGYGGALLAASDYDGALEQYQAAARLEPTSALPLSALGMLWWDRGENEKAEKYLQEVVAKKPDSPWDHEKLGTFYLSLGRYQEAEKQLLTAFKLPGISPELPLMIYLARELGGKSGRRPLVRRARRLGPKKWPGPVCQLYLDDITPKDYLDWVKDQAPSVRRQIKASARYFLAYYYLIKGDKEAAAKNFDWVASNTGPERLSHTASRAELRRMGLVR